MSAPFNFSFWRINLHGVNHDQKAKYAKIIAFNDSFLNNIVII